jgi:hypothetical protein
MGGFLWYGITLIDLVPLSDAGFFNSGGIRIALA